LALVSFLHLFLTQEAFVMPGSDDSSARQRPAGPRDRPSGGGRPGGGSGQQRGAAGRPAGTGRGAASREEIAQRTYDPRREERRKATRVALPEDVDPRMLDGEARRELRSLSKETADLVARHLVMTGRLLDEEPERALAHARAARALAGRVGVVREAAGLAAYAAGEWTEALSELRAARRITGRPEHLGVLADCERALGRPERALTYGDDRQLGELSQDQRVELVIVLAGARRDLGQADAAVLTLQEPARRTSDKRPWAGRLWYAYADALLAAGREELAREWFAKVAAVDTDGETDAGDRLLALDGVVLEDERDDLDASGADLLSEAELSELVRGVVPLEQEQKQAPEPEPEPEPEPRAAVEQAPAAVEAPAPVPVPASGVAPPPFAAPPEPAPAASDEHDDGPEDLRLFD
jgi:hypothetical protein